MRDFEGRTAIVTGASRGIGPYICRALAKRGMNIVLAARDADGLIAEAAGLEALGSRALAVPTDVASGADRETLVARAVEAFGAVDLLVNNAGIELAGHFSEMPAEEAERMIAVNLTGPISLTRALLPAMLERRRGHVVNIASLAGKSPVPFNAVYAATKAGLIGFTQSLHAELRGTGVGASVVSPGFVSEAGMFHDGQLRSQVSVSRMLGVSSPAKVAAAVVRAIERNQADVIVNSTPVRPLLALGAASPGTIQRLLPAFGITKTMRQLAESHRVQEITE